MGQDGDEKGKDHTPEDHQVGDPGETVSQNSFVPEKIGKNAFPVTGAIRFATDAPGGPEPCNPDKEDSDGDSRKQQIKRGQQHLSTSSLSAFCGLVFEYKTRIHRLTTE